MRWSLEAVAAVYIPALMPGMCGCFIHWGSWRGQDDDEEDALDAFMAAEILPEVTAAQQAERAAKEQERLERAKALAVRAAALRKCSGLEQYCAQSRSCAATPPALFPALGSSVAQIPDEGSEPEKDSCVNCCPAATGGQARKHSQAGQDPGRGLRR
jgi:hypothetical protein